MSARAAPHPHPHPPRVGSAPAGVHASRSESSLRRSARVLQLDQVADLPSDSSSTSSVEQDNHLKKATRSTVSAPFIPMPSTSTTPLPGDGSLLEGDESDSDSSSVQSYESSGIHTDLEDAGSEKPPRLSVFLLKKTAQCCKDQVTFRSMLMLLILLSVLLPTLTSSLMVLLYYFCKWLINGRTF